jgi:Ni/Fe-hydrogenase subunit HybB-like protein
MALRFAPIYSQFSDAAHRLPKSVAPANVLLTPDLRASLPVAFLTQLQIALSQSLFWVYALILLFALVGLGAMFFLPGGRADKYAYTPTEEEVEATPGPVSESLANIG